MQFCGDLHLFILPHWYVGAQIVLRTSHTTINLTPHGPINSGRPPRRSIVALSHSANSYLLLLGVTIFLFRLATFFEWFFSIPTGIYDWAVLDQRVWAKSIEHNPELGLVLGKAGAGFLNTRVTTERREERGDNEVEYHLSLWSLIVVNNASAMTNP